MNLRRIDLSIHLGARKSAERSREYYQLARDLGVARHKADEVINNCLQRTLPFLHPTRAEWSKARSMLIDWATGNQTVESTRTFSHTVEDLNLPDMVDPHPDVAPYHERER